MASFNISKVAIVALIALLAIFDLSFAQNSHKDILDAHNKARAEVGVPPLHWNESVEAYALNYAKTRTDTCELVHSAAENYGENLAGGTPTLTAVEGVNLWVGEKKFYDPSSNSCKGDECEHYTQVVWRQSTSVGCARVTCKNGDIFFTCNYYPPGNYVGDRPY